MELKINYISTSKKSALCQATQRIGDIVQTKSGFVQLPEGHTYKVGDMIKIPAGMKMTIEKRQLVDKQTGEVRTFDWLNFEA